MTLAEDRSIQGLRGLAALSVVLLHIGFPTRYGYLVVGWGWAGVELFFVLSGYILGKKWMAGDYHVPSPSGPRWAVAKYYLRRFFRIWPVYWLTIPAFVFLVGVPFTIPMLGMAQYSVFAHPASMVMPSWTLAVEELFYLTLPLWVIATSRRWYPVVFGVALIAAFLPFLLHQPVSQTTPLSLYWQFPTYALAYVLGLVAARGVEVKMPRWLAAATIAGILVVISVATQSDTLTVPLSIVGAYLVLCNWRGSRVLSGNYLVRLGALTYTLYLVGIPMNDAAKYLLGPWEWVYPLHLALALGLSLCLAWGLHKWVEKPVIALGRQVEARWYASKPERWEIAE